MLLLTDMLSVLAAALHLGLVVGLRERLLLASKIRAGSIGGVVELKVVNQTAGCDNAGLTLGR